MEPPENTDGSSIKPVSSLRSHFENMLNGNKPPPTPSTPSLRQPSPTPVDRLEKPEDVMSRADGRISLDIPRNNAGRSSSPQRSDSSQPVPFTPGPKAPPTPLSRPKPRPSSMMAFSPPRSPTRSPPKVMVQSPGSPPKPSEPQIYAPTPPREVSQLSLDSPGSRSASPVSNGARHFRAPSRSTTPAIESKQTPFLQSSTAPTPTVDPRKNMNSDIGANPRSQTQISSPGIPPPINRSAKPKILGKPPVFIDIAPKSTLAPEPMPDVSEERVSPFSTPPSSEGSNPIDDLPPNDRTKSRGPASQEVQPSRESYFAPPPKHRSIADRSKAPDARALGFHSSKQASNIRAQIGGDLPEDRPGLPPRRETTDFRSSTSLSRQQVPPEPPIRRSLDQFRPPPSNSDRFLPPPKRTQTFAPQSTSSFQSPTSGIGSRSVPPRVSMDLRRPSPAQLTLASQVEPYVDDSDDTDALPEKGGSSLTDYPDSSQANRRPPVFAKSIQEIPTKYETKLFAICGEYICTTGYVTRVWSLLTGELLMSLSHGDTIKVTAISFRPVKDVEDEGKRLWLGTNIGEIHEVDIPSQLVVQTKGNAHPRCAIIKIYRYAAEMWSLDEEGRIHIWPPDEKGSPSLAQTPNSFRVPKGHTFSIITGTQLWLATGKDIRIFQRSNDTNSFVHVLQKPLAQPNVGEVTSGAILSSQPDKMYFGHNDGKVTVYAKKDYSCLGVVNVSLYKISSLVGVGDYLWAGYITGMIYVYDTRSNPWKVKKDWHAHSNPIAGIAVDRTSIWKLDRLQVASLGTDNMLRLWDGMLRDDWLESQMQDQDSEFCEFREVTAMVMTWNAGASKPTALRHDERDANFFRDLLQPQNPADILVFGFQELVDLEDKKVTARSFFKKGKKKDAPDHEHMSHQYRAWRDHLVRTIEDTLPSEPYYLLHTANLVGLFTCVFVKSSMKHSIHDVSAAQVKLGMGGLHGNKGALIVRFVIDDSSICFINCHLAAGQTQTMHRNNDIAAIMEAEALPARLDPAGRTDLFVGGGDGSMILDHEVCILNGDLNYRIDTMTRNTVIAAVKENNLNKLLERDQLLLSRKRNPGFRLRAFNEAPITFAPTYKYDVGTNNYDSSEKKRSPAWCDRLLYRGLGRIKQVDYRRHEVRVSDHRPVSGRFKIRVKTISPKLHTVTRERCEDNFEEVKRRIATDIKLDYLTNVFGLSLKEAQKLLKK